MNNIERVEAIVMGLQSHGICAEVAHPGKSIWIEPGAEHYFVDDPMYANASVPEAIARLVGFRAEYAANWATRRATRKAKGETIGGYGTG